MTINLFYQSVIDGYTKTFAKMDFHFSLDVSKHQVKLPIKKWDMQHYITYLVLPNSPFGG